MKLWVLIFYTNYGAINHKYKFLKKENCEKVGKELVKVFKNGKFICNRGDL